LKCFIGVSLACHNPLAGCVQLVGEMVLFTSASL